MEVVAERYVEWQEPEVEAEPEEEEAAEPQLLARRPKHRISTSSESDSVESVVSEVEVAGNGDLKAENGKEGGEIVEDLKLKEAAVVEEVEKLVKAGEVAGVELSGENVYFDKASGIWKCHHCTWTYEVASLVAEHWHSHLLINVKTIDQEITSNFKGFSNGTSGVQFRNTEVSVVEDGSVIQSSEVIDQSVTLQEIHTICKTQIMPIKDDEIEPVYHSSGSVQADGSHHLTLDSTSGNGDVTTRNHNEKGHHIQNYYSEELGVIYEGDPEPIDYDVEGVLKKQETHDLICPNCYSCITRRVILKKRKRVPKDTHPSAKRDRIEEDTGTVHGALGESLTIRGEDTTNDQEVITCWSCFSLLIPSGKGFRLFRLFGGMKQPEPEVISESHSIQTPLLTSGGGGILTEQSSTVNPLQSADGNMVGQKSDMNPATKKKGSDFKLFWSYGNNRDDQSKSSQQISTSQQTGQFSTSSEKTTNISQGAINQVEVNTTNLTMEKDGFQSVGTDYLTTHGQLAGKDKKTEIGSNLKTQENMASTIMFSHEELQIKIEDKPDTEFDSSKDGKLLKSEDIVSAVQGTKLLEKLMTDLGKGSNITADDVRILIENEVKQRVSSGTEQISRDIGIPVTGTQASLREPVVRVGEARDWDILKSIVYGGLIESITSLGVVASAAGAETATLNILVLGLANLIGGLILIFHNLKDLRKSAFEGPSNQVDRYYEILGRRNNFKLHAVIVVLSFLIFGLIPIATYAFTFRKSDNRDYKSLAVIGASLISVTLLSLGKAHTKNSPRPASSYFKSLSYYLTIAISASCLSYVAGKLLNELIEKTGWFDTTSSLNSISFPATVMASQRAWGSY
uniref:C2H2-type domain-containing protein n=1 Tax=Kalanchoe fedtschenkoi TaxID=63787 RepID=A0A7N0RDM8_KALFE